MFSFKHFAVAGVVAILVLYAPQAIASDPPSFKSIDASFISHNAGLVEIHDSIQGLNYGEAQQIDWHYQYNDTSDYRCCSHKVLNNEGGSTNDKSDDYHLCQVYNGGSTAAINALDIDLPIEVLDITGEELFTVSEIAGSSYGVYPSTRFSNKIYNSNNPVITGVDRRLAVSINNEIITSGKREIPKYEVVASNGLAQREFFNIC